MPLLGCVPSKVAIRAANLLAEAGRVRAMAGDATVSPDWAPVAKRIRDEATDDWDDRVAVERFENKDSLGASPRSPPQPSQRSGRWSTTSSGAVDISSPLPLAPRCLPRRRFAPTPLALAGLPAEVVAFVAGQLVLSPNVLAGYRRRPATRSAHVVKVCRELDVRAFGAEDEQRLSAFVAEKVAHTVNTAALVGSR